MNPTTAVMKTKIVLDLECLGEDRLDEVRAYVAALVKTTGRRGSARSNLAGIWKGRGFEGISDLEGEIRGARESPATQVAGSTMSRTLLAKVDSPLAA